MGLEIDVHNYSRLPWTRNVWQVGAGSSKIENWPDEVTLTPSDTLMPTVGVTTAAANSEHLAAIVEDALWMQLGYASDEGSFAVEVLQYFHLVSIGGSDKWSHWDGLTWNAATGSNWSEPTDDTSSYTWTFGTVRVVATPELSDTAGSVRVDITNLPKGH
jgi:hypothetical protein